MMEIDPILLEKALKYVPDARSPSEIALIDEAAKAYLSQHKDQPEPRETKVSTTACGLSADAKEALDWFGDFVSGLGDRNREHEGTIRQALSHPQTPEWQPTHRHKKRGTEYKVLGNAILQTTEPLPDEAWVVIYQGQDGQFWARCKNEFDDGRFEGVAAPTQETVKDRFGCQHEWSSYQGARVVKFKCKKCGEIDD